MGDSEKLVVNDGTDGGRETVVVTGYVQINGTLAMVTNLRPVTSKNETMPDDPAKEGKSSI